jgi:murein DD-endopeptidase MepM/ murein hydrolase activator NlpD
MRLHHLLLILLLHVSLLASEPIDPWPTVIDCNPGETVSLTRGGRTWTLRLDTLDHRYQPDQRRDNPDGRVIVEAIAQVTLDGISTTLHARPYTMPSEIAGLRLLLETTAAWSGGIRPVLGLQRAARFTAVRSGETWGPATVRFPIVGYRWRSSPYSNTFGSLVPSGGIYYHRGEDLGAIPDLLPVIAPLPGIIRESPRPTGPVQSNALIIDVADDYLMRLSHTNYPFISERAIAGAAVQAGDVLARTGSTWNGGTNQHSDPHLHWSLNHAGAERNIFPTAVESYLRDYPDVALPIAGGYQLTRIGDEVQLDGSRSLTRPGHRIIGFTWVLHDGRMVDGPIAPLTYFSPGLFAEELRLRLDDGSDYRDVLQVRVHTTGTTGGIGGWIHHTPVRGITPTTPVTIWNRLQRDESYLIDHGDGSPPEAFPGSHIHRFPRVGTYTMTASPAQGDGPRFKAIVMVDGP